METINQIIYDITKKEIPFTGELTSIAGIATGDISLTPVFDWGTRKRRTGAAKNNNLVTKRTI